MMIRRLLSFPWKIKLQQLPADTIQQPLLAPSRIQQLLQSVDSLGLDSLRLIYSRAQKRGEHASFSVGHGIEFEELRGYQPGDDVRDMEWKVTLRTGMPHIKLKRDERRAKLHLLLDRRASMRFATCSMLKVARAAEMAILLLQAAKRLQMDIELSFIDPQSLSSMCLADGVSTGLLINELVAACPPLSAGSQNTGWRDVLEQLEARREHTSWLVILSDFAGLEAAQQSSLAAISSRCLVSAIQVIDAVEEELPRMGKISLVSPGGVDAGEVDSNDEQLQRQYRQQQQARLQATEHLLNKTGIHLWRCHSHDDSLTLFQAMVQHDIG